MVDDLLRRSSRSWRRSTEALSVYERPTSAESRRQDRIETAFTEARILAMPWMVILRCDDNSYYVGSTIDLQQRVRDHNNGNGAQYTTRRRPVELIYSAEFADIRQAYAAEKQVQGWSRAKREALIRGDFEALPGLAKKGFDKYRARRKANEVKPGSRYGSGGDFR